MKFGRKINGFSRAAASAATVISAQGFGLNCFYEKSPIRSSCVDDFIEWVFAKIQRGGMGTDMPNFGTLFTAEETLELVEYLWHLSFETPSQ